MGRKVYITSDMSTDDELLRVSDADSLAALLWPWILTAMDDWGRAEASPRHLKARVFPGVDIVTAEGIESALNLFAAERLIVLYEVSGKPYMAVDPETWWKYQTHIRKEKRTVDGSSCPPPPEGAFGESCSRESARSRAQSRADDSECEEARAVAGNFIPSPSPSPSGTDDDDTRAREEGPVDNSSLPRPSVKNVADTYVSVFGKFPTPIIREELIEWLTLLGDELVIEALRRTAAANTRSWRYAEAILRNWADCGVRTMADVERADLERRASASKADGAHNARAAPAPPADKAVPVTVDPDVAQRVDAEFAAVMREAEKHASG